MRNTPGNTASGGGVSSLLHMAIHRQLASQHPKGSKGIVVTGGAGATPGEIALARKLSLALQHSWSSLRRRSSQPRQTNNNNSSTSNTTHATPTGTQHQHQHPPPGGVYKRTTPGSPHPTRRGTALGKRAHDADTTIASAAEAEQIASPSASPTRNTESRRRVHFNENPPVVVEYESCYERAEGQVAKPLKSVKRSTALHSEFITTAADEDPNLMYAFNMLDMYATMAKTVEA